MAITYENAAGASSSAATTETASTTTSASADILVAHVGWHNDGASRSVSSITFDSDSMTSGVSAELNDGGFRTGSAQYYLLGPAAKTANVSVTMSASCDTLFLQTFSIVGAEQQAPEATANTTDSTSPQEVSISTVTANAGITASLVTGRDTSVTSLTGSNLTVQDEEIIASVASDAAGFGSRVVTTATSYTQGFTVNGSGSLFLGQLTALAWEESTAVSTPPRIYLPLMGVG